ncbi:MAG TPA: response regulator transcription factor, partial [Anaerolineales bacterium]|nr:response regulator transcription factor [Anaerolineales bacterium]
MGERITRPRNKIRILLVDDHANLRAGVRRLLETTRDIIVVGEASDGYQALELVERLEPDIVILDVEMPRMNGLVAARKLSDRYESVKILALSAYDDRQYVLGMLDQGASGYLIKDEVPEMLIQAVRDISLG